ncbi:hypothetical protein PO909_014558 [Leuciscus waleckii]
MASSSSSPELLLQGFPEVAQQALVPLRAQVDPVSAQMEQADVCVAKASHLSISQEAGHRPVDPAPGELHAVARPAPLTFPAQPRQDIREYQPGSGKQPEALGQVALHFPEETQAVAALPTQAVPAEVDDDDVRLGSCGPEEAQSWEKMLPESAVGDPADLAVKTEVRVQALVTDVCVQSVDDGVAHDPDPWLHLEEE